MSTIANRVSLANIKQATQLISPVFLQSPQYISDSLNVAVGARVVVKIETANPIRCFKGRGADLLVAKANPNTSIVCASAGNFGQAMAYSCKKRNIPITIYASLHANPYKLERMRALGATVIQYGKDFDEAKEEAKQMANDATRFVEDSQDIETVEGAATIALELLAFGEMIDTYAIALGNGAMLNGMASVIKSAQPHAKVVAVQATGAPAMVESWRMGKIVTHKTINTIADGIAVRLPVPQALEDMKGLVDDALLVTDDNIIEAMKLIHQHLGIIAEPSGAVGLAAIMENPEMFKNQTVATVICGGNLTTEQVKEWLR
jgi:threonine dehydratase